MLLNKLNTMRNESDSENGFTLIELMVVVVIIGILAAIAIPIFANQQKEGIKAGVKSDVKNTVSNISVGLVSVPTATTITSSNGGLDIVFSGAGGATKTVQAVLTSDNIIIVAGAWDGYVVTGRNPAVVDWSYVFRSKTGQFGEAVFSQQEEDLKATVRANVESNVNEILRPDYIAMSGYNATSINSAPYNKIRFEYGVGNRSINTIKTGANTVLVSTPAGSPGWSHFIVTGANPGVSGWSYKYDASTGLYEEVDIP